MASRFDFWNTTGGSTATVTSNESVHTSSSKRIFQSRPGVEDAANNFYCGSKVTNPGPGAYDVASVKGSARSVAFGRSQRLMTASNMQWDNHHEPYVETHLVDNADRQKLIRVTLSNKIYRYNRIKDRKRENGRLTGPEIEEFKALHAQIKQLKDALRAAGEAVQSRAKTPAPAPVPFATHGALPAHEKPAKFDSAPRFYRSDADWDFGSQSRGSTINMAAFNYPLEHQADMKDESYSDLRVMTGVRKPKSRCRKTDFFGLNAGERSISPNAFSHTPELVPTSILKHHRTIDDATSVASGGSRMSRTWTSQQFTTRQLATAGRSRAKSRTGISRLNSSDGMSSSGRRAVDFRADSDDMSEVSEITMGTRNSRGPRFMDSGYARRQFQKDKNGTAKSSKTKNRCARASPLSSSDFFPSINISRSEDFYDPSPQRFTVSTDDNFAAKCGKPKSPILRRKPSPVDTSAELLLSPINKSRR